MEYVLILRGKVFSRYNHTCQLWRISSYGNKGPAAISKAGPAVRRHIQIAQTGVTQSELTTVGSISSKLRQVSDIV